MQIAGVMLSYRTKTWVSGFSYAQWGRSTKDFQQNDWVLPVANSLRGSCHGKTILRPAKSQRPCIIDLAQVNNKLTKTIHSNFFSKSFHCSHRILSIISLFVCGANAQLAANFLLYYIDCILLSKRHFHRETRACLFLLLSSYLISHITSSDTGLIRFNNFAMVSRWNALKSREIFSIWENWKVQPT